MIEKHIREMVQSFIDENNIAKYKVENVTRLNIEEHQTSNGNNIDWESIKSHIDKYRKAINIKQDKKLYKCVFIPP